MNTLARTQNAANGILQCASQSVQNNLNPILRDLITGLIGRLIECDHPVDGADAVALVSDNYDGDGKYDSRFLLRVARAVRQEARHQGKRVTRSESHDIARATLENIRTGDPTDITLCIREVEEYRESNNRSHTGIAIGRLVIGSSTE